MHRDAQGIVEAGAQGGFIDELQPLGRNVPYTNDSSPVMHGVRLIGRALPGAAVSATVQARAGCATAGAAPASTFAFTETMNTTAAKAISETKAKAQGKVVVETKPPVCSASMSAMADCAAKCDATVKPGSAKGGHR